MAQKVFAAKLEDRDLAAEKKEFRNKMVADSVDDLLEAFIVQHISQNRSAREILRMLRREIGSAWGSRNIHEISKRDVIDMVSAVEQRGAPVQAGTISGVAAVRHRHDFIAERREALEMCGTHVRHIIGDRFENRDLRIVA